MSKTLRRLGVADAGWDEIRRVLDCWGWSIAVPDELERAATGFSEATVWRAKTSVGPICLRRWAVEHPSAERLAWIHGVLRRVAAAGCPFVPAPLLRPGGESFAAIDGRLWEATPWMPGSPEAAATVGRGRAEAVARALAAFHRAAYEPSSLAPAPSPGLAERLAKLDRALGGEFAALQVAPMPVGWNELRPRQRDFARHFARRAEAVREQLARVAATPVELVPCIRDIRREHVLFTGDEVTGWVDFGAMQIDTPAIDVARLLVEFGNDDDELQQTITSEYLDRSKGQVKYSGATAGSSSSAQESSINTAGSSSSAQESSINTAGQASSGTQFHPDQILLQASNLGTPARPSLAWAEPTLVAAFAAGTALLSPYQWFRWILMEGRDFADRDSVLRRIDDLLRRLERS